MHENPPPDVSLPKLRFPLNVRQPQLAKVIVGPIREVFSRGGNALFPLVQWSKVVLFLLLLKLTIWNELISSHKTRIRELGIYILNLLKSHYHHANGRQGLDPPKISLVVRSVE